MTRAVLLVDHGSRLPEANALLEAVAARVRERLPDLAAPTIPEAIDACVAQGAGEIVLAPWFLSPGAHSVRDLPRIVEEAARRHPAVRIRCAAPLGFDERLVEVLLERLAET
jgi:sirohydrochlorin ferrochelatase